MKQWNLTTVIATFDKFQGEKRMKLDCSGLRSQQLVKICSSDCQSCGKERDKTMV